MSATSLLKTDQTIFFDPTFGELFVPAAAPNQTLNLSYAWYQQE
jgi:hypothetical protein